MRRLRRRTHPAADLHDSARAVMEPMAYREGPLRVRVGIDATAYRVGELSEEGFSVIGAPPLPEGVLTHASFQLGPGLSISVQATSCAWRQDAARQWFVFTDVDAEVLGLLLLTGATVGVH